MRGVEDVAPYGFARIPVACEDTPPSPPLVRGGAEERGGGVVSAMHVSYRVALRIAYILFSYVNNM